jgi:hypothetical protein
LPGDRGSARFLHQKSGLPPLVRTGLAHVQFETINPYLDGYGRIGRLLVTLLLYLSLFFDRHRAEYYGRLYTARTDGDIEGWLAFFLEASQSSPTRRWPRRVTCSRSSPRTEPTATKAADSLVQAGVLVETTGRRPLPSRLSRERPFDL